MSAQLAPRAYPSIKQVMELRRVQREWQRVVDMPGVRPSAKTNAEAKVAHIEAVIRGG